MKKLPLICPCKLRGSLKKLNNVFICKNKKCEHNNIKNGFSIIDSIPIIISEKRTDTVCQKSSFNTYIKRSSSKLKIMQRFIIGKSDTTKKNCDNFIKNLFLYRKNPKVLIIGGAEKGAFTENLFNNNKIEIHSTDIYITENIDFICDSHHLSVKSNFYDGVWIQAVIEHVVNPNIVVDEIFRVLKLNGIVYAETSFMQQVHEGSYDFNRYTALGHRYLFKKFKLIDFGGDKGPEVVLVWSIRYLVWSIFRSKTLGKIISLFFALVLRPLKILVSKKSMHDASSSVYFLGKKIDNHNIKHKELIKLYKGQF
jgi:hypothetical protein